LYGGAAMLYIAALRHIPMSVALPFSAVSYVAAALIGHYAFGERLTGLHLGALAMIVFGVLLLAVASG
jgi:small multidrug resistance pump